MCENNCCASFAPRTAGFYTYRTTTDKLAADLNRIQESGDQVRWLEHVGGRDWVAVCVKAATRV